VSESDGGAIAIAERLKKDHPEYNPRVTVLGHIQRGGSPSAYDRILASRLGAAAIEALLDDQRNIMVGISNDSIVYVPLVRAIKDKKSVDQTLFNTLKMLSI